MDLYLYNTLTRQKEKFKPLYPPEVKMYTCGPTVYYYPHIGNWRTFVFEDILRRVFEYNGYRVTQIMNLTDVGHLTGDNLGHADAGEDRQEKAAKKEGKTVWQVADFYTADFVESLKLLNILPPSHLVKATDHIGEQINLIQKLFEKGFAYETSTGVFFEVEKLADYGKLGGQKLIDKRVAARGEVEEDRTKKHAADFALWLKTVGKFADHIMHWDSPWGEGFPGWHLECSAIAMKYLGQTLDVHCGGVDHIAIHHTNELAQSETSTGVPFSRFWLHGEFLLADGGRMGKSLGNAYTLHEITDKGFSPSALRYFYFGAHYRKQQNFTWEALEASQKALGKIYQIFASEPAPLQSPTPGVGLSNRGLPGSVRDNSSGLEGRRLIGCAEYEEKFLKAVNDDLDIPGAVSVVWDLVKSDYPLSAKKASLFKFDEVLGLGLENFSSAISEIPFEVEKLVDERSKAREAGDFQKSDDLRRQIKDKGWIAEDTAKGTAVKKKL